VAQSCEQGLTCHDALPIVLGSSGAGDGTSVSNNYVAISVSPTTANFTWKLTQSQAAGYPVLSQHIDGSAVVDASAGPPGTYVSAPASVRLLLTIDKFPSNEAYQYPRYTDNGFPVAHELATCDQAGPGSLGLRYLSTPTYGQRTCGNW